jgi:hypothetical protein
LPALAYLGHHTQQLKNKKANKRGITLLLKKEALAQPFAPLHLNSNQKGKGERNSRYSPLAVGRVEYRGVGKKNALQKKIRKMTDEPSRKKPKKKSMRQRMKKKSE